MMNPMTIMKMFNERHQFIKNHPEVYPFLKEMFGSEMNEGTIIKISVEKPGEEEKSVSMKVQESEKALFRAVQEMFK